MSQANKTIVSVKGVSKNFGSVVAVDHLDIDIKAGEFVTFLGPSGCGKSTTLRILGGFEIPDRGRVILDGEDVTALPPNKRNVNMVFQDYALFPHMTVSQNISFGLELKGLTRSQIAARRDEVMAFLELEGFEDRYPEQLSGGQRQRVALARALAPDPSLLLLDEPLGALDAKLRAQVQEELKSIQQRTNTTFFFVTHDQDEALTMSDRIVVMNNGRVEQDGTPEELYFHPASRFVAEFIGETNLLSGVFLGTEHGEQVIEWQGIKIRGRSNHPAPQSGSTIVSSLRFEKLQLHKTQPDTTNAVRGRITSHVFKGSRSVVTLALDSSDGAELKAYLDPFMAADMTEGPVWVSWNSGDLAVLRS